MVRPFLITTFLALLISSYLCGQSQQMENKAGALSKDIVDGDSLYLVRSEQITPLDFLAAMKTKRNQVYMLGVSTVVDSFPSTWVKKADVDTLIKLIYSKEKCDCFLSPLSSNIPIGDSADVGGYAIRLIESYRQRKNLSFGLYSCPKTNKADADRLIKWWARQK